MISASRRPLGGLIGGAQPTRRRAISLEDERMPATSIDRILRFNAEELGEAAATDAG